MSLIRIIKFAFQDFARNLGLSTMTVFILVLMLLSVNTLWTIRVLTAEAVVLTKNQVSLSLYLSPNATDKQINELKSYVQSLKEVTNLSTVPREEVLKNFKDRHRLNTEILAALTELGGNPFGPTLVVEAREPEQYKNIMTALNVPEYESVIEGQSFAEHEEALTRLQTITNRIERVGWGLTILFAIIAFLIIFNTIRVAIHTHSMEISIKRLVGANNWFIRGPYIVEAFLFTALSVAITVGAVLFALRWIDPYLTVIFANGFNLTSYYTLNLVPIFGAEALAVLLLTLISSSLAMHRQLRV
jgi:cell division transport system permease protein